MAPNRPPCRDLPGRPGDPATPMSARQVAVSLLHDWTTYVVLLLGTLGLIRVSPVRSPEVPLAQAGPPAGQADPGAENAASASGPTVAVPGASPVLPGTAAVPVVAKHPVAALVDSLIDRGIILVMVVMWGWQRWKETQRAERVADDRVNQEGLRGEIAAAKAEAAAARAERDAALGQVVDREARIQEVRENYEQRLADREARSLYLTAQIADFKDQVAAQDRRLNDLLNQMASMAESMDSVTSETRKTRRQVTAVRKEVQASGAGGDGPAAGDQGAIPTMVQIDPGQQPIPVRQVDGPGAQQG